jgi:ABC-type branched-subunit amino acid transport system ATPase component
VTVEAAPRGPSPVELGSAGLVVDSLSVEYGEAVAVDHVSLTVEPGQIVALLGANGAGKSSLLLAISGMEPAVTGSVAVGDISLDERPAEERALFAAHVPEGRRLFPQHTVRENLVLAAYGADRADQKERLEHVHRVLPRLAELGDRRAELLSGGEQQMVALGRGIMSHAPVLMIDELSLGLAPTVAQQFAQALRVLRDEGYAILIVEQYVTLAMSIADEVMVLDHGRVVLQGSVEDVRANVMALEEAYLGREGSTAAALLEEEAAELDEPAAPVEPKPIPAAARAQPHVPLVGLVILLASMFAPWFSAETFDGKTTEFTGFDMPIRFIIPTFAFALVTVVIGLVRLGRRSPLSLRWGVASGVAGLMVEILMLARVWALDDGLPKIPGATYSREWGLFVALNTAAAFLIGGISLIRERVATDKSVREALAPPDTKAR